MKRENRKEKVHETQETTKKKKENSPAHPFSAIEEEGKGQENKN